MVSSSRFFWHGRLRLPCPMPKGICFGMPWSASAHHGHGRAARSLRASCCLCDGAPRGVLLQSVRPTRRSSVGLTAPRQSLKENKKLKKNRAEQPRELPGCTGTRPSWRTRSPAGKTGRSSRENCMFGLFTPFITPCGKGNDTNMNDKRTNIQS